MSFNVHYNDNVDMTPYHQKHDYDDDDDVVDNNYIDSDGDGVDNVYIYSIFSHMEHHDKRPWSRSIFFV